jgi:hypothetical protein
MRLPEGVKIEVKVDLAAVILAVGALVKLFMQTDGLPRGGPFPLSPVVTRALDLQSAP